MNDEILSYLGYISPNGTNMANPVLVARQLEGLQAAIERIQKSNGSQVGLHSDRAQTFIRRRNFNNVMV